jgi:1,2-diacylglycerol 3-beta-glucosyltransferase
MWSMETVLWILAGIYAGRVTFFLVGSARASRQWNRAQYVPTVTIVVPARNESSTVHRLISSLERIEYPAHLLEIILVNDRSTDSTPELLDEAARRNPQIRVLHRREEDANGNVSGKPGALQHGIDHATGEIIVMTDADCTIPPSWPAAMAMQFADPSVGLVSALTSVSGSSFFARMQDVEWTYMQTMACGGVGNGYPLGCFGNNLAVRRAAFEALGGYRSIAFSVTEDLALQQAMHEAGHELRFFIRPETAVTTLPLLTMMDYWKQRHRWARGGMGLGMRGLIFVLTSMALWTGLLIAGLQGAWLWFIFFIALRLVADGVLISATAVKLRRLSLLPWIIPSMIVLVLTELVLPILILKTSVQWKGQVFRR